MFSDRWVVGDFERCLVHVVQHAASNQMRGQLDFHSCIDNQVAVHLHHCAERGFYVHHDVLLDRR